MSTIKFMFTQNIYYIQNQNTWNYILKKDKNESDELTHLQLLPRYRNVERANYISISNQFKHENDFQLNIATLPLRKSQFEWRNSFFSKFNRPIKIVDFWGSPLFSLRLFTQIIIVGHDFLKKPLSKTDKQFSKVIFFEFNIQKQAPEGRMPPKETSGGQWARISYLITRKDR